jgi:hypothetical protein
MHRQPLCEREKKKGHYHPLFYIPFVLHNAVPSTTPICGDKPVVTSLLTVREQSGLRTAGFSTSRTCYLQPRVILSFRTL